MGSGGREEGEWDDRPSESIAQREVQDVAEGVLMGAEDGSGMIAVQRADGHDHDDEIHDCHGQSDSWKEAVRDQHRFDVVQLSEAGIYHLHVRHVTTRFTADGNMANQ